MGRSGRAWELVGKEDLAVMLLLKFLAHICQDLSNPGKKKREKEWLSCHNGDFDRKCQFKGFLS